MDPMSTDFRDLDRRAADFYLTFVAQVKPADLTLATPCSDWTLHGLLRHQVSQDEGFAAAARGDGGDLQVWRNGSLGDDPHAAARASLDLVTGAFAEEGVPDRPFLMPEVTDRPVPGRMAVSFHFVDLVVHAWDVAATLGLPWEPSAEMLEASLAVAALVPTDDATRGPGLAFDRAVPAPEDVSPGDRLLTLLGRSPSWAPSQYRWV